MQRLGVMGGTFDPIHNGHLLLAQFLKEHLSLDRVFFIPAATPPHKAYHGNSLSPIEERWAMVCTALIGVESFDPSRIEMDRPGKSYTVETIRELQQQHPNSELFLLIGADNIADMETWFEPDEILSLCTVVAGSRMSPETPHNPHIADRITIINTPIFDISSTEIRNRVNLGRSIRWLVPEKVETYIRDKGLYR